MNPRSAAGGATPRLATPGGIYAPTQYAPRSSPVKPPPAATPIAALLPPGLLGSMAAATAYLRRPVHGTTTRHQDTDKTGYNITCFPPPPEPAPEPFVCPDRTGGPDAPCFRRLQNSPLGLEIERDGQVSHCPVAATTGCEPFLNWRPFQQRQLTDLARAAGVPARLATASFDTATPTLALTRARRYAEAELFHGRALCLLGPTGTGKSFAAICVLRHHHAHRRAPGVFAFAPELVSALLDRETRAATVARMKSTRCLILDDVGSEHRPDGGFVDSLIDEILWHREAEQRATVLTSNLTSEAFKSRFSDRIVDRLAGEWGSTFAGAGRSLRRSLTP